MLFALVMHIYVNISSNMSFGFIIVSSSKRRPITDAKAIHFLVEWTIVRG